MDESKHSQSKPAIDPGKVPFGHEEDPPLASTPAAASDGFPAIDLLADGANRAHEALDAPGNEEGPLFPPQHVKGAGHAEPPGRPPEGDGDDAAQGGAAQDAGDGFRRFVRDHPLASMLAAVALGALLVAAATR